MSSPARRLALIGHRGARGLSPENTLASFETAFAIGVDAIEFDVVMTRDDEAVVVHNAKLESFLTRDAHGDWLQAPLPIVRELSWDELQSFDVGRLQPGSAYAGQFAEQQACDGARVPHLRDVIHAFKQPGRSHIDLCIELKITPTEAEQYAPPEAFVRAVVDVLRAEDVCSRTQIKSFDWRVLQIVQSLAPELPTAYLSSGHYGLKLQDLPPELLQWTAGFDPRAYGGSIPQTIRAAGGQIWSSDHRDITPEAVAEAHALGLRVWTWTANAPEDMRRVIDAGVDGVITDYPNRLRDVVQDLGLPLPVPTPRP